MKIINGSITAPKGFKAAGNHIGIKKVKKDLAIVVSDAPAEMAGTFTTNIVKAAPVTWDIKIAESKKKVHAILVNSGNANACTGEKGQKDNGEMATTLADCLQISADEVLVCSTGVIGVPLPIDIIREGIKATAPMLGYSAEDGALSAEAIMTTDTFMKTIAVTIEIGGKTVTIGGMCKGSGMIHPNMATLLSFVTTDAAINREMLEKALKSSTEDTYNMISVDGDTSTNDTLLILANGLAENKLIDSENGDYTVFKEALDFVNRKLAIDIARDGEGATKLMEVKVTGANTQKDAKVIAKSVISSNLFKAALFGADANWGRVLCAMGYSGGDFDPNGVTIVFRDTNNRKIMLMESGVPIPFDEDKAKEILMNKDIFIDIQLTGGNFEAVAWGCDLTYDYVKINGDYRS